jgi:Ca2+-binding EF-hand superfamily protein
MSKPAASKPAFDPAKYAKKNLPAETVVKLKEVFDVFDYDGSGNISVDELVNTVKALNLEAQASQVLAIVNNAGVSGDFDFGTFIEIFGFGGDSTNEGTLQTVFEAFDTTGSGAFGPEEFEKVASSVGEHFSAAEVDQMIEFADKDRDGVINFEEFQAVVARVYPKV